MRKYGAAGVKERAARERALAACAATAAAREVIRGLELQCAGLRGELAAAKAAAPD